VPSDVSAATVMLGRTVLADPARQALRISEERTGIRSSVTASGRSPSITTSTIF
jgi:hypothetical protein